MNTKIVTIIIPVYNARSTLQRCVDSVINQTYRSWNLILVDDGSVDGSDKLCDEYVKKDARILVIHQHNRGVSVARNVGLENAKGEFVTFIDSDDYVDKLYLEHLCSRDADYIVSGMQDMPEGHATTLKDGFYKDDEMGIILSREINSILFKSPWCKLYRMIIIRNAHLMFDSKIRFGEDSLFNLQYLDNCNSLACVNTPDYKYFIPTSVGKYYIEHEQYRYILYKKVQAYKVLEMNKKVRNKYYLEQEFHDLTTRLFIGELMKKFSTKNRKEFLYTFRCCSEIKYINPLKGGRLYALILKLIQQRHCIIAFYLLRFVYPLSLIGSKRII